jgi:uncharacterized protein YbaR (Trm112 family)
VRQAAQNIFAKYGVSSFFEGEQEYFTFSGDSLHLIFVSPTDIKYWVEDYGDERSVLYITAINKNTDLHTTCLRQTIVQNRIKRYLAAIEAENVSVSNQLFLAEQYTRVFRLTDEIQMLQNDLRSLETHSPNADHQINQLRSTIRGRIVLLNQEVDILNRFKASVEPCIQPL